MKIPRKQIFRDFFRLINRLSLLEKLMYSFFTIALLRAVYATIINIAKNFINYIVENYQIIIAIFLGITLLGLGLYLYISRARQYKQKIVDKNLNSIDDETNATRNIYTGGGNFNENIHGDVIEIHGNTIYIEHDFSEIAQELRELITKLKNQGYSEEDAETEIANDLAEEARKKPNVRKKMFMWKKSFSTNTAITHDEKEVAKEVVKTATIYNSTSSNNFTEVPLGTYHRLNELLKANKWKEADLETAKLIHILAEEEDSTLAEMLNFNKKPRKRSQRENFIYTPFFTYYFFPNSRNIGVVLKKDLNTIDKLWKKYSNGRFGFSVQKRIWKSLGGGSDTSHNTIEIKEKFGDVVGWRKDGDWVYYADLNYYNHKKAPHGHLPIIFMLQSGASQRCSINFSILEVIVGRI
ncbi:hypothetical protein BCD64_16315 [Nostoc sp. MBR 210]|nr:hypothetical protein BCD64_16315 [Nostoc sp. MBR 210]